MDLPPPRRLQPVAKPLRIKESWVAALPDHAKALGVQLLCSGGSGALARTAVAPLERIKVCGGVSRGYAGPSIGTRPGQPRKAPRSTPGRACGPQRPADHELVPWLSLACVKDVDCLLYSLLLPAVGRSLGRGCGAGSLQSLLLCACANPIPWRLFLPLCAALPTQILRQVQHMAALDNAVRYNGLRDALWRIPQREGGLRASLTSGPAAATAPQLTTRQLAPFSNYSSA